VTPEAIEGWSVIPPQRRLGEEELRRGVLAISGKKARLSSRGVEKAGLPPEIAELAERKYEQDELSKKEDHGDGKRPNYPDRIYRARRARPLLVLYNVGLKTDGLSEDIRASVPDEPVVGWALSFPISARPDRKVEYILNPVALRELFGDDGADEDSFDD
jgi:hypothetical protein